MRQGIMVLPVDDAEQREFRRDVFQSQDRFLLAVHTVG